MISGKTLLTTEQIQSKVIDLANKISKDYKGKEILMIGMLRGAFMFFADLVRHIKVPVLIDFIIASSYLQTTTSGEVKIHYDLKEDIENKHVIIVDDIIDSGITLNFIRERLLMRNPASLKVCVLLDKEDRRVVDVPVDYLGYKIPNEFVIGYGLDYENNYRNLPYVAIFKKSHKKPK
ncbi:MAG: hypoxanthine phosphoribosyltransferase [Thermodesulfovibrionales bacterium]|nr:hypoxanthine phosphoribosyltransferase [Thermodesulfovibrionales bacterium]